MKNTLSHQDFNIKTIEFVKEINFNSNNERVLKALDFTPDELEDFLRGKKEINALQFFNLAKILNFSIKAFFEDKIDIEAIKKHNTGDKTHIPKEYQTEIGTKHFILSLSLEYIEIDLGPKYKQNVINYLQLPTIYDPSKEIGSKVSDDLNQYLDSLGYTKNDYQNLGYFCISRIMQTFFPDKSKFPPTLNEYLVWFFEAVMPKWVEKNCLYKTTIMEEGHIEYVAELNPLLKDKFAKENIGNENQCYKKAGGTKALLDYYTPNQAVVTHPKCLHRGDDKCLFSINF